MKQDDRQVLYQKKGVTISNVASSLLSRNTGDRIPSISYYQEEYGVSRGTIQNAFRYLKEAGAVENLTEAVREAKRQYMREWRKKNPERVKANNRRYWERKAKELQESRGEHNAKTDN